MRHISVILTGTLLYHALCIENPENFVNLLAGTFTDGRSYSTGNTLPLIGRPWGFNHWAPQTTPQNKKSSSWWFNGNHHVLTWLRCTHQPSPWIGDWGWFLFMPMIGPYTDNPHYWWEPRGAVIKPHLFDVTLAPQGMRVELVPTDHGATLRVSFPRNSESSEKRVCFREGNWESKQDILSSPYLTGVARQVNTDRMRVPNFGLYIHAVSLTPAKTEDHHGVACFKYGPRDSTVEVRIATSLISPEQARFNLEHEMSSGTSFDELKQEAQAVWNKLLKRVNVVDAGPVSGDTTKYLTTFYSGLYRALTFPRRIGQYPQFSAGGFDISCYPQADEVDRNTKELVHFSPYDQQGKVYSGPLVTDNGFWDTFRTVYPLLGLAYRNELGTIVEGWLNAYREGGWLPSWASPGYRNCMVGTFADVVVADAVVKKITGFDYETARLALKKDSFEEPPGHVGSAMGKEGLNEYSRIGFVPTDHGNMEGVSRTLDFGFADYATARAFESLLTDELYIRQHADKKTELAEDISRLDSRWPRAVKSQFSPLHGLMAPRRGDGTVVRSFDPLEWGNGFVEGNSWHHSFPPYALKELAALYGGESKLLNKLHEMLDTTSDFRVGSYRQEIHEMTEMRSLAMGQYGHNNQPSHHILFLFSLLGERESTEKYVREVIERGYGVDFYAGDEDNGEQGAWFVLASVGLFSATPGTEDYNLNTPLFKHVVVSRDDTGTNVGELHIISEGSSPTSIHTKRIYLNGREINSATVRDSEIRSGGVLQYVLNEGEELITMEQARSMLSPHAEYDNKLQKLNDEIKSLQSQLSEVSSKNIVAPAAAENVPEYMKLRQAPDMHGDDMASVIRSKHLREETAQGEIDCNSLNNMEIGLLVVTVNLAILCFMLILQLHKRSVQHGDDFGHGMNMNGSYGDIVRTVTCCCNPMFVTQCLVRLLGLETVHSVVGRPNKKEPHTV